MSASSIHEVTDEFVPPLPDPRFTPRIGVFESIRRHWLLFVLPVLICVGAGVAYGLLRTPTYSAETTLTVGKVDLSQPGALSGFATATSALASNYSRDIYAQQVATEVAAKTGLDVATVRGSLNATPVPESPVFRVQATGTSEAGTVRLVNVAATTLADYVAQSNTGTGPVTDQLLNRYRAAQRAVTRAVQAVSTAAGRFKVSATAANGQALARARGDLEAAKLRAQTLSTVYQQNVLSQHSLQPAQILSPATSATSDRTSRLEIAGFAGLLLGAFVGAALATLRAHVLIRRALMRLQ